MLMPRDQLRAAVPILATGLSGLVFFALSMLISATHFA